MGKKIPEVMAAERDKFIAGAREKGFDAHTARDVFNLIEPFAGYAFNKAHSISYAMIAYWTAYFRANYPTEYFAALLNACSGNSDKLAECGREARRNGIEILLPDVNRSLEQFSIEKKDDGETAIRYGLAMVNNVGTAAVGPIVAAREEGGAFSSLEDFCRRVDFQALNSLSLESLVKVGALDGIGQRGSLIQAVNRIMSVGQRQTQLRKSGQTSMFDMFREATPAPMPEIELPPSEDISPREQSAWERELLGIEFNESDFTRHIQAASGQFVVFANELNADSVGKSVKALGQVADVRERTTRRGDAFLAMSLRLLDGGIELVAWPNVLENTKGLWEEGKYVVASGEVREWQGRMSISVEQASEYKLPTSPETDETNGLVVPQERPAPSRERPEMQKPKPAETAYASAQDNAANGVREEPAPSYGTANEVTVRLRESGHLAEDRHRLEDVVRVMLEYQGQATVMLEVDTDGQLVKMEAPFVKVDPCEELESRLAELVGAGNVALPASRGNG